MIVKAASDAEDGPSVTEIMILGSVPTSVAVGVPVSAPVVVLKLAQEGLFWMLKVRVDPLGPLAVGVKL
jgi:hypothetical protein